MIDLIAAIYENEGWIRKEGESRTERCNRFYHITVNHKKAQYVAVRKTDGR
jgi:hypothetical protein